MVRLESRRSLHTPETSVCVGPNCRPRRSEDRRDHEFDLFVLGGGSAGVRAARYAARYGARVALCELPRDPVSSDEFGGTGGTCVLRGCVPKKLMSYAAHFAEDFDDANGFGWQVDGAPNLDFKQLMSNKRDETERLSDIYLDMLKDAGVTFITGRGEVQDAHTVTVNGESYKAENILVATGSRAVIPPIEGAKEYGINSDHVLNLDAFPKRLVVVGGGYIACEQASIYNGLGSEVHLIMRQELPLKGFDEECRKLILEQYRLRGTHVHGNSSPAKVVKDTDGRLTVHVDPKDGDPYTINEVDQVLFATGRKPKSTGLGLEQVGVKLDDKGAIAVDKYSRSTTVPSIWAIGDVTNRKPLTPAARMEGSCFAMYLFGKDKSAIPDFENVASVVFSSPELATVGLSEEAAVEKHKNVDIFTSKFTPMKNVLSRREVKDLVKVVVDAHSNQVLGYHMVGSGAADILQGFATCLKVGVTKRQLDMTVGIHPTSAEEFVTMAKPIRKYRDGTLIDPDQNGG